MQWRHVPSEQNSADCAYRGISADALRSQKLWWQGPPWLSQHSSAWPDRATSKAALSTISTEAARASVQIITPDPEWDLPDRVSSWTALLRATAYARCYIQNLQAKRNALPRVTSRLSRDDLHNAELFWLRTVQAAQFEPERRSLQKTGVIPRSSRLWTLQPFLGDDSLLRLGRRFEHAPLELSERHPILLANHRIVHLLIDQAHRTTLHGGTQLTLRVFRQRYWVISACSLVKQHIRDCVTCVRHRAQPMSQKMAALPAHRVTPSPPFFVTGLDYAGPFMVTSHVARGQRTSKHYVAVFVCFTTKAVHLESVEDYSTPAFLATFLRFASQRGLPAHVYSDNGTNFQDADRELRRAWKLLNTDKQLHATTASQRIAWHFTLPAALHFGGLWKAAVKSFKLHVRRIVDSRILSRTEFATLLCQIEACLNSRPLKAQSDDPSDLTALTPGHFLIGRSLAVPERSVGDIHSSALTRWQQVCAMQELFWRRWSHDHLHTLHARSKWTDPKTNLRIGELILLRDNLLPPAQLKLGRIIQTYPGADRLVRVVTIKTATSELRRPIAQLCRLPITVNLASEASRSNTCV